MKVISWNVNGRVGHAYDRQLGELLGLRPDILCLQEVTRSSEPRWQKGVLGLGMAHVASSVEGLAGGRRYANLIAASWPLERLPIDGLGLPFPEKLLSALLESPVGPVEVHVAHLPPGVDYPEEKVATFEAIYSRLATGSSVPRILCGDFNTPKAESADGDIVTWADSRPDMRERWDLAERSVIQGLAAFDLPDVYRGLHGYGPREPTWIPHTGRKDVVRRYDHLFASRSLNPVACRYLHGLREARLSDHSPVEAVFEPDAS